MSSLLSNSLRGETAEKLVEIIEKALKSSGVYHPDFQVSIDLKDITFSNASAEYPRFVPIDHSFNIVIGNIRGSHD